MEKPSVMVLKEHSGVHVTTERYADLGSPDVEEKEQVFKSRGGVAGPAGPAKAGPLFSRALVSFPDSRDGLPTRWLSQVSHASSPLPSACRRFSYKSFPLFCQQIMQEPGAARPDCIGTHVLLNTHAYTTCSC